MLYTFNNGTKKKFTDIYTFLNGTKYKFHTMYTYVNGEKKYLMLPKVEKPYYMCYTPSAADSSSPLVRTFYKVYLDGTSTDETFTHTYRTNKGTTKPYFEGFKYDKDYRRLVIWGTDATSMSETCTMYYDIYNAGDMKLVKTLSHPFEYPCSYTSSLYNNKKHVLMTLGSGMYYTNSEWTKNPRNLRIVDLVNLKLLTKTFSWPNGYISTLMGSYYMESTGKLRIMFKNYYDPYSTTVSTGAILVYDVNLTSDEYDLQPIFSKYFTTHTGTLALSYAQNMRYTSSEFWECRYIMIDPCSGTATISNKTRPVSNTFYVYDYVTNSIVAEMGHAQSYAASGTTGIVSPNDASTTGMYVKYLDLAKTDTTMFAVRPNGVATPNSRIGQRWTNAQNIISWTPNLCLYTSASDSTSGVGKAVFYGSGQYSGTDYYLPTIYESVTGNPISSTATSSFAVGASYKYMLANRKENDGVFRYLNLWEANDVYNNNTRKLDLFTNSRIANLGSSVTISNLFIY